MADPIPFDPLLPADLFRTVCEALETAHDELETLNEPDEWLRDALVPDAWDRMAGEHAAMAIVIRRIARAAPSDRKRRLGEMCRDALAGHRYTGIGDLARIPILPEVTQQVEDALEQVRRRALVDGNVREALTDG